MAGYAKKCAVRCCELANGTTQQLYKVSTPCIDDHHCKEEEEMKSVGELAQVCSQIVLQCLYLAHIGRLDILWSVNKHARSKTKWTKASDKRLNLLISYIHHACECKQYRYVGNTAKQCRLGLFQDSDFSGDLEDSKSTSGGTLCVFGSHIVDPISWMCKKQTFVSHSSTESEITSLDARLRLDGISAFDLWDLIDSALGNTNQTCFQNPQCCVQIKYVDTKNQLEDTLTRGHFTCDEWNHLLCLFNISHFSSINNHEAMSKRTQEDASEERVTAKSKPIMNLVSRHRVRDPNVLASTASESPGKTNSENQNVPPNSLNVQQTITERPVLCASSSNYSEWNIGDRWSSQVWKSGEMSNTSTGRPVYEKFVIDDHMDSDTATESNHSLRSRSFLDRVNDRFRNMLDRSPEDAMQDIDKRSMIWRMFMSSTVEASAFMGKNYSQFTFHQNTVKISF